MSDIPAVSDHALDEMLIFVMLFAMLLQVVTAVLLCDSSGSFQTQVL